MKYLSVLITTLTGTALLLGCSTINTTPIEPSFLSFGVVDQENRTHVAKADETFKTMTINTISEPYQVTNIKYRLTPKTSIDPNPSTMIGANCKKNNKFTLTSGDKEVQWHVLFPNFGKEDKPKEWVLEWEDEFNGDWYNEDIWNVTPEGKPDWCSQMAPYKDLYQVNNGILTLWAKKNTNHPEDERDCLTGGLWTRNLKSFKEGKLVIRARHKQAKGFWPAIWLRPQDGPKDEYSEIDIVELVKGKAFQTIHTDYSIAMKEQGTPVKDNTISLYLENFEGWHEYFVEIHENEIRLGIDGKTTLVYTKRTDLKPGDPQQFPFYDRSFYLILSAQLGGKWAGQPSLVELPVSLDIDYVKYYRLK